MCAPAWTAGCPAPGGGGYGGWARWSPGPSSPVVNRAGVVGHPGRRRRTSPALVALSGQPGHPGDGRQAGQRRPDLGVPARPRHGRAEPGGDHRAGARRGADVRPAGPASAAACGAYPAALDRAGGPAAGPGGSAIVTVDSPTLRTVELVLAPQDMPAAVAGLCEDLALHDWLLTTLSSLMEAVVTRSGNGQEHVERCVPVLEHLLHLWLPGARVRPATAAHLGPVGAGARIQPPVELVGELDPRSDLSVGNLALLRDLASRMSVDQPCGR